MPFKSLAAMGIRKRWGEGVAARQRRERNRKAKQVVEWALPHLDMEQIESSGEIWPRGSLKRKKVREVIEPWIRKTTGRFFTLKVSKLVCRQIWDKLPFTPPRDPSMSFSGYMLVQAKRLIELSKASKKRCRRMADPTMLDTLVDVDALFSVVSERCPKSVASKNCISDTGNRWNTFRNLDFKQSIPLYFQ